MAGYGDELIATGLARGAAARGKRIAFGNGKTILWGPHSAEIFKGNPNIAPPGSEHQPDIEWIAYYKGHRLYNVGHGTHWTWNENFRPSPGEVFLDRHEIEYAERVTPPGIIIIEPNVPWHKRGAVNKDWGLKRYQAVADRLLEDGHNVAQFAIGRDRLSGVRTIKTPTFRHALAVMARGALLVAPEGGLHHGAAAVGLHAVVIFGGFIPPGATGYETHINLTAGAPACGKLSPCEHCREALNAIGVGEVIAAAYSIPFKRAA